jgi:hypothetical protein
MSNRRLTRDMLRGAPARRRYCSYPNAYPNQVQNGGVRGCSPMFTNRLDLQKPDTNGHPRTRCVYLGVKWSQVQILSARPKKYGLSCVNAVG